MTSALPFGLRSGEEIGNDPGMGVLRVRRRGGEHRAGKRLSPKSDRARKLRPSRVPS